MSRRPYPLNRRHHSSARHTQLGHDRGLASDLRAMRWLEATASRREALQWLAGATAVPLLGCAGASETGGADVSGGIGVGGGSGVGGSGGMGSTAQADCPNIPPEGAGPFPGDGSNGPNVLNIDGVVRQDLRASIGALSGTAAGVELTVELRLVNGADGCAPLSGAAVYLWQCDRDGKYSLYDLTDKNYLRGVQEASDDGVVRFTTVFPGCYPGRWPHIHLEVFPSLDAAMTVGSKIATSQFGFPEETCNDVYAVSGYEVSVDALSRLSLASDIIFRDGADYQIPVMSGDADAGYLAELTVGVTR